MKIKQGDVAVITGGGGGIGRALAQALAAKGCDLALVDVNQQALDAAQVAVQEFGVKTCLYTVDITRFDEVEKLARDVVAKQGKADILINCAGMTIQKSFVTHSLEDWQRMIGVNFMSVIHSCKAFMPALKLAGKGGWCTHY